MGRAEDEFFKGLRSPDIYERIKVQQLLFYLSGVLSAGNVEQLQAKLERHGNSYVVFDLLNDLRKRDNWVNHLLEALWRSEQVDLYNVLRDRYRRLEPQNDIYSPPGLPPASQYSNPPPYNSLPPPEESRERREPYMQPELRNIQAAPPAETSPPLLVANETDNGAPDDDITKMPIPESRSLPTPSFVENVKVVESPENNLPTPPANNLHVVHNAVTEPNQRELPGHQLVVGSAAKCQPASAENNHHDVHNPVAVPSQPEFPGHQLVVGSPEKHLPASPVNNYHDVRNPAAVPCQPESPGRQLVVESPEKYPPASPANNPHNPKAISRQPELPGYQPVIGPPEKCPPASPANNRPDAHNHVTEPRQFHVHQPVAGSPVNRPPNAPENDHHVVNNVPMESGQQELPGHQRSPPQSSCRPIDELLFSKPGVLVSNPDVADTTREDSQPSPLSQLPELQISDVSEPPQISHGAQQPTGGQTRATASNGSLTPQENPANSTPKESGSPRRRRPEENDEPGGESIRSREPEENSYSTPNGPGSFRLQYSEEAPAEGMDANSAPRHRIVTTPEVKETSDRKEHEVCSNTSNLENPVVLVLAATVVCLVLYIAWLKRKS